MTAPHHAPPGAGQVRWQHARVRSPRLPDAVRVVAAHDLPYRPGANRFQNLSVYLPETPETLGLLGTPVTALPGARPGTALPRYHVHVHGGAWRDPNLTSRSVEPAVAHAFSGIGAGDAAPLVAVASLNYRLSQFSTHPQQPYDAERDQHSDPAREAVHPQHLDDVLHGLAALGALGLTDGSYVLSGHSCGACLVLQATLQAPSHHDLPETPAPPRPAAVLGLNGLYDLPALVDGLDPPHAHLRAEYEMLLSNAFGAAKGAWPAASPARFEPAEVAAWVRKGRMSRPVRRPPGAGPSAAGPGTAAARRVVDLAGPNRLRQMTLRGARPLSPDVTASGRGCGRAGCPPSAGSRPLLRCWPCPISAVPRAARGRSRRAP